MDALIALETNINIIQNGIEVPRFIFDEVSYGKASEQLGLSLLQDIEDVPELPTDHTILTLPQGTLGGGKQTASFDITSFIVAQTGEGENSMFTILQPSFEDAQGVLKMQTIKAGVSLISNKVFNALMMVDFCNPIYSWRRGVLMQYVPGETTFNPENKTYDMETKFIANVKDSKPFKVEDKDSPESQFISLLDTALPDLQSRIKRYFDAVDSRLKTVDGVLDYLTLAESRRRIYRPVPLNEFGMTLPYALNYGPTADARYEMTETGTIVPMAERGVLFFRKLTATQDEISLAGFDPRIIPAPDGGAALGGPVLSKLMSSLTLASAGKHNQEDVMKKARACPFRRANVGRRRENYLNHSSAVEV